MMLPQSELSETHAVKCELAGDVLRSSGTLRLQVSGWSMLPAIRPGDVLVIHRAGSEDVSKGDIVLFSRDRRLFAHRVVSIKPCGFRDSHPRRRYARARSNRSRGSTCWEEFL